jgi:hypothetical protein
MHPSQLMSASYEVGDTTERWVPERARVREKTAEYVRPRAFPRPSSMYPMVSIEDADDADPSPATDRQYMTASVAWPP